MGAGQSTSQVHPPSRALHVLRVTPSSPASRTSIEPFFDFVVGFEGDSLSSEKNIDVGQLERIVEGHEGRTLDLIVWSAKNQQTRVVPIIPSRAWSQPQTDTLHQDNASPSQPSLLGLSMRICEPETATENVWHVLDVLEGSPAESAGLVPMGDWILGWSGGVLGAENDFYDLVEAHVDKPLRVYVYSYDFDALREVVLIPNRHWGGEGLLGCVFGFGLLHRIPSQPADRLPGTTPMELQEATGEYEEQELFVPADVHSEPHFSAEQLAEWRRQEQEQWHQETLTSRTMYEPGLSVSGRDPSSTSAPFRTRALNDDYGQNHDHNAHEPSHNHFDHNTHLENHRTPRRSPAPADDSLTSTFAGPLMNGTRTAQRLSSRLPERISSQPDAGSDIPEFRGDSSDGSIDRNGDDHDGEASVTGTEATSQGSLTSVD